MGSHGQHQPQTARGEERRRDEDRREDPDEQRDAADRDRCRALLLRKIPRGNLRDAVQDKWLTRGDHDLPGELHDE